MKIHGGTLLFCKRSQLERLLTILLQLYDIPEKAKLVSEKISGSTSQRGRDSRGSTGNFRTVKFSMILEQWMHDIMHLSKLNFTAQRVYLIRLWALVDNNIPILVPLL